MAKHASGQVTESYFSENQRTQLIHEARYYVAAYLLAVLVSVVFSSAAILWLWILPVVVGQPALRVFLLSEHTGCDQVPDMLSNTRTTLSNCLVRWLSWNMSFHVEHHAYAAVPFFALPDLHQKIKLRIVHLADGYTQTTRDLWDRTAQS